MPVGVGLHEVADVEHGLAKKLRAALGLDLQQATLDGPHAGRADVAVFGGELAGVVAHMLQHGAQVFQVQQQQAVVVGDLEHQVQHTGLGVVQVQHAANQQRPHVGHGGTHRVALFTKHVPQRGGAGQGCGQLDTSVFQHRSQFVANLAGLADTRQVALDVGHEDRHPDAGEIFSQGLQGDCLARAGGTCDQAVAVGQGRDEETFGSGVAGNQKRVGHEVVLGKGGWQKVKSGCNG